MRGKAVATILAALFALGSAPPLTAQTSEDAKADGKAFATEMIGEARDAATATPDAARIPNFNPQATRRLQDLSRDPDRIEASARSAATTSTPMRMIRDSMSSRAKFDPNEIADMLARSRAISETPLDYTSGMAVTGSQGACVPLPPGSASAGTYMATCNTGFSATRETGSCEVTLDASVEARDVYGYYCITGTGIDPSNIYACDNYQAPQCRVVQSWDIPCGYDIYSGYSWGCYGILRVDLVSCSEPVPGATPYTVTSENVVTTTRNESQCSGFLDNGECTLDAETCTDISPQTRIVDGIEVTQGCWAWQRSYSCARRTAGNDCGELEANGSCRFLREDCLTEDTPCSTSERVYECPLPPGESGGTQYVCDGDVYCIDGSCETIQRTANDEFKDAVTALHAMDEAREQFDPDTLTLFRGTRNTCASKVFGVLNCCKGKGFPLIPGISLLVALGCSRGEILLHERDSQGLCAYVGTYCSDKFLGVCLTKKKVYCCFESKLSRILQEQGRRQLPKPWDKPKNEQCLGFTLDEFARLDLSQMDFSEVYAEFTEAARLPDELETSILIQQKIEDYYARSGQ